jgi:hypothetical protein
MLLILVTDLGPKSSLIRLCTMPQQPPHDCIVIGRSLVERAEFSLSSIGIQVLPIRAGSFKASVVGHRLIGQELPWLVLVLLYSRQTDLRLVRARLHLTFRSQKWDCVANYPLIFRQTFASSLRSLILDGKQLLRERDLVTISFSTGA